jgi:hypothetical protein
MIPARGGAQSTKFQEGKPYSIAWTARRLKVPQAGRPDEAR